MGYMKPNDERLLFLPLGGSGEIGMNLNLYGHKGKWLMVDCGMSFADSYTPGVDLIFPDPSFIEDEQEALVGLIVTHGHEDHIGAIPHIWSRFKCPIYTTGFTAELIRRKLGEHGLVDDVEIIEVVPSQSFDCGPFKVEYVPLAHSIAEGHGITLTTSRGVLFHTGDWKLDKAPLIGPTCPSPRLKALGDQGVLAMIGDSTNVFNPETSGSEKDVQENLLKIVGKAEGRVVITTFASNVARLEAVGAIAKATGRNLCLFGRSMQRIYEVARAKGFLQDFPKLVDVDAVDYLPKNKVLIVCTGCQGESRAALARIAKDEHRDVSLVPGDTVIFSSKIIPGNELTLFRLINNLVKKKVNVITEKDDFVHVSGHPGQPDLKAMYEWVRPKFAIPVHGEARHLIKHAEFALEQGVKKSIAPKNGQIIEITDEGPVVIDEAPIGVLVLDGTQVVDFDAPSVAQRRRISQQGQMTIVVVIRRDGQLASEPVITANGIPKFDEDDFYYDLIDAAEEGYERLSRKERQKDKAIHDGVRIAVRRLTRSELGRNPTVDVVIVREQELDLK
ncbi:ribonuclease J [Temperatibacter marinus]|uniref:Ribonuclease J n=1 Tax=Temperatibacter marinus TaxID=1456591 RepID=A0AA52ECY3_9PROT|nr:ribonuclease J [Temperatibacter marinus]WND02400.1 ribonuclease J [Temperatibacter marinus]